MKAAQGVVRGHDDVPRNVRLPWKVSPCEGRARSRKSRRLVIEKLRESQPLPHFENRPPRVIHDLIELHPHLDQ